MQVGEYFNRFAVSRRSAVGRQEAVSRIRGASADQENASRPPVHVRGADVGERTGIQGRLGLQQRRLRRPGVRAEPEPGTAAGHVVQRGLQRQDTLRRRDTRLHARVRRSFRRGKDEK